MSATRTSSWLETPEQTGNGLSGRLAASLADPAPGFDDEDAALLAFHGIRQGFDPHQAAERARQGLGPEYHFTLRLRLPAGRLSAAQYLALDDIADRHGNGNLRLAPRQGIELPGLLKRDLREAIAALALARLTSFAAGGAVARAAASVAPGGDPVQRRLEEDARRLSDHLLPRTEAYDALWLDGAVDTGEVDPLYGPAYLPKKLEIGLALPEDDTVEIMTRDIALLAHADGDRLAGYSLALGGNRTSAASPIAFIEAPQLLAAGAAVVALFRDFGVRPDGQPARLADLVAARGTAWIKARIEAALGTTLAPPRALPPRAVVDHLGWREQADGRFALGVAAPGGRIADAAGASFRTALRLVCKNFAPSLLVAPRGIVIIADVAPTARLTLAAALSRFGVAPQAPEAAFRNAS